jgi:hypothetical protein
LVAVVLAVAEGPADDALYPDRRATIGVATMAITSSARAHPGSLNGGSVVEN